MHQEDFNMLNSDIVYLDNGATTLKPRVLAETVSDYYNNYSANAHRGDYDISLKVDNLYENTRELVRTLINAKSTKEIVFTSGTTDSLNKIAIGFAKNYLKENDEVLITLAEHASNVLPWFELKESNNIKVNYIKLDNDHKVTLDAVKKAITDKTRIISLAHITNVIGDVRPIKDIIKYAHEHNIIVIVDGAQSVPHKKIDVQDLDIDFLAFSAHKMCGPTGVGVLYGKEELLYKMKPIIVGGGMNAFFEEDTTKEYSDIPYRFEGGTPNIAGVIGYGKVLEYLLTIGLENISNYELELRKYAIDKLKQNKKITIYNENSDSGIITFNYENVFSQDLAVYLNKYHICLRAGNHCAKILKNEIGVKNTCRLSLYFYNTKVDIDRLCDALDNPNLINEII